SKANGSEVKLYRSTKDTSWFAFGSKIGWMMFPAEVGGWQERQPTCGADLIELREVPLCMGFDTGIPGAPMSTSAASAAAHGRRHHGAKSRKKEGKDHMPYLPAQRMCGPLLLSSCGMCSIVEDGARKRILATVTESAAMLGTQ